MIDFCLVGAGFIGPVHAANLAAHPKARQAHLEMAERYDELGSAIIAHDLRLSPEFAAP